MNNTVEGIVASFDAMVRSDDGRVSLVDPTTDSPSSVHVRYEMSSKPGCDTCIITAEMLEAFLKEALTAHGVDVTEVIVEAVPR